MLGILAQMQRRSFLAGFPLQLIMAMQGQRFELDLDSDDFAIRPFNDNENQSALAIKEIREHDTSDIPPAPTAKPSKFGFPAHKSRHNTPTFRQKQQSVNANHLMQDSKPQYQPSDQAIRHHLGKKQGVDFEVQQRAEISEENNKRLAGMSMEDIEETRAELLSGLSPGLMEKLIKRANIDGDATQTTTRAEERPQAPGPGEEEDMTSHELTTEAGEDNAPPPPDTSLPEGSSVHFPVPPRSASSYKALDPSSDTFHDDLRSTYFPELAHDPSSISWLQDPTPEDDQHSSYNPTLSSYPASSLRFDFNGRMIPPKESLKIPVSAGLHHHGDAPSSAGYTIPELTLLARSTMPNQRCIAYQTAGRILYRLGKGDFGQRASEMEEAIWDIIEHERILELIMVEANKQGGHVSAKSYATEALWLWRKGGGGDRELLRPGEQRAK